MDTISTVPAFDALKIGAQDRALELVEELRVLIYAGIQCTTYILNVDPSSITYGHRSQENRGSRPLSCT